MKSIIIAAFLLLNAHFLGSFTTKTSQFHPNSCPDLMYKCPDKRLILFYKIAQQESSNGVNVFNEKENAVGILQIRPIMVREVNEILGYTRFILEDRWDDDMSFEMFCVYMDRFNPNYDVYHGARIWNGGRRGHLKNTTIAYANSVILK